MLLLCALALAHRPGLSYAQVEADTLTLTFARPELAVLSPGLEPAVLTDATLGRVRVTVDGAPCHLAPTGMTPVEGDGLGFHARLDCPTGDRRELVADYLADLAPGHRSYVQEGTEARGVLDAAHPSVTLSAPPSTAAVATRFLGLGVEHIWTGYDHLAFLVGLLLVARGLREMLLIVTGFTVAHSITLSLGATGLFTLPPAVVEPAIAASIAYVGLENFWNPAPRRRVLTTFALGFVHGFGFAGLLAELGLPDRALGVALGSFNLGVELGQAAVVAAVLPLLLLLRRRETWTTRVVPLASAAVAVAGVWWLVERLGEA